MSSYKAVEVIYADFSKMSQPVESCSVCSPRMKEFRFNTSKKKAGSFQVFFSSSWEMISWPIIDI